VRGVHVMVVVDVDGDLHHPQHQQSKPMRTNERVESISELVGDVI
jgi:hypothetical protein